MSSLSLEAFLKPLSSSSTEMALSDNEITGAIKTGQFHIVPRNPKLNPAGIDLRADRSLVLKPGQQRLVATIERVELSERFLGILHIRSSLAREGIVASLALVHLGFSVQLSGILHLPETVLSRYVKGHVLPTAERAEEINRTLQKYMSLEKELHERIKFDDLGYFDNTGIINDTMLLERAVQQAVGKFAGKRVNKVMTAAVDGVPLATLLAHRLGTRLIVAKQSREVGVREFIEEFYVPPKTAIMKSLYVSKDAFKKGEGVLIADDIIDSGETQRAMMKVILKARAEVIGIYALVAIGNEWKSRIESVGNVPVEIGLSLVKMVA